MSPGGIGMVGFFSGFSVTIASVATKPKMSSTPSVSSQHAIASCRP